ALRAPPGRTARSARAPRSPRACFRRSSSSVRSSADGGRARSVGVLEGNERRHLDVAQLDPYERRSGVVETLPERARELGGGPAILRPETGEHRGDTGAEMRPPEGVVPGVLLEQEPFSHEAHAVRVVVEDDVGDGEAMLDR